MKRITPFLTSAFILLTACNHKELCDINNYIPEYNSELIIECSNEWLSQDESLPQWIEHWPDSFGIPYDSLLPGKPNGVRAQIYKENGTFDIRNLPLKGGTLDFTDDKRRSMLFYNNDTRRIIFKELNNYYNAYATTRTVTRNSYQGNSLTGQQTTADEQTMGQPDYLFGEYIESFYPKRRTCNDTTYVYMTPWVYSYLIRYEFSHGLKYVALARGALSGMAKAVRLSTGTATSQQATILYDCTMEDFGAQAIINTFGLPDESRSRTGHSAGKVGLNLEVLLKNGERMQFEFDITHQLQLQPKGGVIIVRNIVIPDEIGEKGDSAFDVDIDGWGEYEDVELPL